MPEDLANLDHINTVTIMKISLSKRELKVEVTSPGSTGQLINKEVVPPYFILNLKIKGLP